MFSARFALEAATRVAAPPAVRLYRGYTLHRAAADLADDVARAKQEVFARYAMFDTTIVRPPTPAGYLDDIDRHVAGDYKLSAAGSWERRRVAAATLAPVTGVLATAAGACLGSDLATADCASAPAWELGADREVRLAGGDACLAVDGETVALAPCGGPATSVFPLTTGSCAHPAAAASRCRRARPRRRRRAWPRSPMATCSTSRSRRRRGSSSCSSRQ